MNSTGLCVGIFIAGCAAWVAASAFGRRADGRRRALANVGVFAIAGLALCGLLPACAPGGASASSQASTPSAAASSPASSAAGAASGEPAETSSDAGVAQAEPPEPMAKTVVCIGDSITSGGVFTYDEPEPWCTYLQYDLADAYDDWTVVNLGVSGTTLLEEGIAPYRATGNVEVAKDLAPDMAIIMLGTNDSSDANWNAEAYRAELRALVEELKAVRADMHIVLMAPPAVFCDPDPSGSGVFHMDDAIIGEVIGPIVKEVAEEEGAQFVDLHQLTEGHPEWFPDTVHPDGQGNRAIAAYIRQQVFS